jgi:hypothetical protein
VLDVDVLKAEISDKKIKDLLDGYQHSVVQANIQLEGKKHEREVTEQQEELTRAIANAKAETAKHNADLQVQVLSNELLVLMKRVSNTLEKTKKEREAETEIQSNLDFTHGKTLDRSQKDADQAHAISKKAQDLELAMLTAEVEGIVKRFGAIAPGLGSALATISEHAVAERIAQALSVQTIIGGESFTDTWTKMFKDTPLAATMSRLLKNSPPVLTETAGNGAR